MQRCGRDYNLFGNDIQLDYLATSEVVVYTTHVRSEVPSRVGPNVGVICIFAFEFRRFLCYIHVVFTNIFMILYQLINCRANSRTEPRWRCE